MSVLRPWRFIGVVAAAAMVLPVSALAAVAERIVAVAAAPATAPAGDDEEEESREDATEAETATQPANGVVVMPGQEPGPTPQRGFSVRKEDPKLIDALEDFRRHSQKKAWEQAFRALGQAAERAGTNTRGMVPAGDGLMVPTRQHVWNALVHLPPDGREAYRLFNDAAAKQQFERATAAAPASSGATSGSAADDVGALEAIFDRYFITSVGDRAADRLGDARFEAGDFLAADAAWKAILDYYPDTGLSRTKLRLKRCAALSRAGRWDALDEVATALTADGSAAAEPVRLAGRNVTAAEYVASLGKSAITSNAPPAALARANTELSAPLQLPRKNRPLWQMRFMDDSLTEKFEQSLRNMGWSGSEAPTGSTVPPSAADGKRVYVNWLGIAFALDAKTGKLLWRSRKFSDLANLAQQLMYGGINPSRYQLALDGDRFFITGLPLDQGNMGMGPMGPTCRLVCHNAENGSVVWSTRTGDGAAYNILSAPVPVGGTVYVAASRLTQQEVHLLALSGDKGKLLWSVSLGTPQASVDYRGQSQAPSPLLLHQAGTVYVVTNNGAVLAVDTAGRRVQWAFTCEPPPVLSGYVMFFNPSITRNQVKTPGAAFIRDSVLYFKESGGYAVYALDLAGPALKWKRPADASHTIAAVGRNVLMIGEEVSAIDPATRAMRWSTSLPIQTGDLRPLLAGDRMYVFSARGVYEIDTATGDPSGQPFRGADLESVGGALWHCGDKLVAVSNLSVTAYPLPPAAERRSAAE